MNSPIDDDYQDNPPKGFKLLDLQGGMIAQNGPLYIKEDEDPIRFGFRAKKAHTNRAGILHGGMTMTFADCVMGLTLSRKTGKGSVTVRFNTDFLAMARPGDWIEGRGWVTGQDGEFIFVKSELTRGTSLVMRASGIFKVLKGHERRKARQNELPHQSPI